MRIRLRLNYTTGIGIFLMCILSLAQAIDRYSHFSDTKSFISLSRVEHDTVLIGEPVKLHLNTNLKLELATLISFDINDGVSVNDISSSCKDVDGYPIFSISHTFDSLYAFQSLVTTDVNNRNNITCYFDLTPIIESPEVSMVSFLMYSHDTKSTMYHYYPARVRLTAKHTGIDREAHTFNITIVRESNDSRLPSEYGALRLLQRDLDGNQILYRDFNNTNCVDYDNNVIGVFYTSGIFQYAPIDPELISQKGPLSCSMSIPYHFEDTCVSLVFINVDMNTEQADVVDYHSDGVMCVNGNIQVSIVPDSHIRLRAFPTKKNSVVLDFDNNNVVVNPVLNLFTVTGFNMTSDTLDEGGVVDVGMYCSATELAYAMDKSDMYFSAVYASHDQTLVFNTEFILNRNGIVWMHNYTNAAYIECNFPIHGSNSFSVDSDVQMNVYRHLDLSRPPTYSVDASVTELAFTPPTITLSSEIKTDNLTVTPDKFVLYHLDVKGYSTSPLYVLDLVFDPRPSFLAMGDNQTEVACGEYECINGVTLGCFSLNNIIGYRPINFNSSLPYIDFTCTIMPSPSYPLYYTLPSDLNDNKQSLQPPVYHTKSPSPSSSNTSPLSPDSLHPFISTNTNTTVHYISTNTNTVGYHKLKTIDQDIDIGMYSTHTLTSSNVTVISSNVVSNISQYTPFYPQSHVHVRLPNSHTPLSLFTLSASVNVYPQFSTPLDLPPYVFTSESVDIPVSPTVLNLVQSNAYTNTTKPEPFSLLFNSSSPLSSITSHCAWGNFSLSDSLTIKYVPLEKSNVNNEVIECFMSIVFQDVSESINVFFASTIISNDDDSVSINLASQQLTISTQVLTTVSCKDDCVLNTEHPLHLSFSFGSSIFKSIIFKSISVTSTLDTRSTIFFANECMSPLDNSTVATIDPNTNTFTFTDSDGVSGNVECVVKTLAIAGSSTTSHNSKTVHLSVYSSDKLIGMSHYSLSNSNNNGQDDVSDYITLSVDGLAYHYTGRPFVEFVLLSSSIQYGAITISGVPMDTYSQVLCDKPDSATMDLILDITPDSPHSIVVSNIPTGVFKCRVYYEPQASLSTASGLRKQGDRYIVSLSYSVQGSSVLTTSAATYVTHTLPFSVTDDITRNKLNHINSVNYVLSDYPLSLHVNYIDHHHVLLTSHLDLSFMVYFLISSQPNQTPLAKCEISFGGSVPPLSIETDVAVETVSENDEVVASVLHAQFKNVDYFKNPFSLFEPIVYKCFVTFIPISQIGSKNVIPLENTTVNSFKSSEYSITNIDPFRKRKEQFKVSSIDKGIGLYFELFDVDPSHVQETYDRAVLEYYLFHKVGDDMLPFKPYRYPGQNDYDFDFAYGKLTLISSNSTKNYPITYTSAIFLQQTIQYNYPLVISTTAKYNPDTVVYTLEENNCLFDVDFRVHNSTDSTIPSTLDVSITNSRKYTVPFHFEGNVGTVVVLTTHDISILTPDECNVTPFTSPNTQNVALQFTINLTPSANSENVCKFTATFRNYATCASFPSALMPDLSSVHTGSIVPEVRYYLPPVAAKPLMSYISVYNDGLKVYWAMFVCININTPIYIQDIWRLSDAPELVPPSSTVDTSSWTRTTYKTLNVYQLNISSVNIRKTDSLEFVLPILSFDEMPVTDIRLFYGHYELGLFYSFSDPKNVVMVDVLAIIDGKVEPLVEPLIDYDQSYQMTFSIVPTHNSTVYISTNNSPVTVKSCQSDFFPSIATSFRHINEIRDNNSTTNVNTAINTVAFDVRGLTVEEILFGLNINGLNSRRVTCEVEVWSEEDSVSRMYSGYGEISMVNNVTGRTYAAYHLSKFNPLPFNVVDVKIGLGGQKGSSLSPDILEEIKDTIINNINKGIEQQTGGLTPDTIPSLTIDDLIVDVTEEDMNITIKKDDDTQIYLKDSVLSTVTDNWMGVFDKLHFKENVTLNVYNTTGTTISPSCRHQFSDNCNLCKVSVNYDRLVFDCPNPTEGDNDSKDNSLFYFGITNSMLIMIFTILIMF